MSHLFQAKFITKCYCINKNKEILILKKAPHAKHWPNQRDLPWWGIEHHDIQNNINEIFLNWITRELHEESWLTIHTKNITLLYQTTTKEKKIIKLFQFYVTQVEDIPEIILSKEHTEYQRTSYEQFTQTEFHLDGINHWKHKEQLRTICTL